MIEKLQKKSDFEKMRNCILTRERISPVNIIDRMLLNGASLQKMIEIVREEMKRIGVRTFFEHPSEIKAHIESRRKMGFMVKEEMGIFKYVDFKKKNKKEEEND